MEQLQIKTGVIKLQIVDDSGDEIGVFKFSPGDTIVAQKYYDFMKEFSSVKNDFEKARENCKDEEEQLEEINKEIKYFKDKLEYIYGDGTCENLFGKFTTVDMFDDFFEGIAPFYKKASEKRVSKYKK